MKETDYEHELDEGFLLDSGRHIRANHCILGIDYDGVLTQGYDGTACMFEEALTAAERKDIAGFMAAKWRAWGGL